MASRYQIIKDEEELVRMLKAGLLYLDYRVGRKSPSVWERVLPDSSVETVLEGYRLAFTSDYVFLPDEYAFLVEDDEDNGQ